MGGLVTVHEFGSTNTRIEALLRKIFLGMDDPEILTKGWSVIFVDGLL